MNHLEGWKVQFDKEATRCWRKVMTHWINDDGTQDYPVNWEGLNKLLKDVRFEKVAKDLKKALASTMHHST